MPRQGLTKRRAFIRALWPALWLLGLLGRSGAAHAETTLKCPPRATVQEKRDAQGRLLARGCRLGSVNDGPMMLFDPSGWKERDVFYRHGALDGDVTLYYPSGNKRLTGRYRRGQADGRFTAFDEQQKPLGSYVLKAGTGKRIEWYPSGKKRQEAELRQGKAHGTVTDYYENGRVETRVLYRDGKKEGRAESFWPDGTKKSTTEYRNDLQDGPALMWNAQGKKIEEAHFAAGELHGKRVRFDDQGRFVSASCIIDGRLLWTLPPEGSAPEPAELKQFQTVVGVHPCP